MSDQTCDIKFKIESFDILRRPYYDGMLSTEDAEFLQAQCESASYEIIEDAKLIIQFHQSYKSIEILKNMRARYNIELCYSSHSMKFKKCVLDSFKSVTSHGDILVEAKFICEAEPGLPVEFEHIKFDDYEIKEYESKRAI